MAVIEQEDAKRKWATNEDWKSIRPLFTQLYREEKLKLREVIQILENQHNFYATPRMYKTRIKDWGLGKNLQADHILSVLHSQQQRLLEHKASEFTVRGVKVDQRRLRTYLKRKPELVKSFEDGACPSVAAAGEVGFRTPSPSPESTSVPMPVFSTRQQDLYDRLTVYINARWPQQVWDDGFLDRPTTTARPHNGLEELTSLWKNLIVPEEHQIIYRAIPLRNLIDLPNSSFPQVLHNQPPLLLSWALGLMAYFHHIACQTLFRDFMTCLVHLTQSSLGENHSLEGIWRQSFEILQKGGRRRALDKVYNHAMGVIFRSRNVGDGIVVEGVKELHHLWKATGMQPSTAVRTMGQLHV